MSKTNKQSTLSVSMAAVLVLVSSVCAGFGQVDFGYVPVGTTNTLSGYYFYGGEYGGSQIVMTSEEFTGSNAPNFSTSPSYAGQTLDYGQSYPFSLSFTPQSAGFETAALEWYETPAPPFGDYSFAVQGTGIPNDRPATGPIVPELAPLEQAMTNYLATHEFEAGTIALMFNSKLVLRQGYGWRDTNFTKVIHPDNLFRLASVSKMFTASAIQKLVDAGSITTNMLMYEYLGIPPWGGVLGDNRITNITVGMLLNHSGGWNRDISPVGDPPFSTIEISDDLGLNYPAAPTNVISWMFSKPLDFAPGTESDYSNFGYQILGRIIEKASGKSFMDYIQQTLLTNAGLTNSIGFLNVIQSRSRPRDLAPWEIWYGDLPTLYPSAVDFPDTNIMLRFADGGGYYESYDSFGGISASAIGLCNYLLKYWEGGDKRVAGNYGWDYIFYGSLPGSTSVLYQDITQTPTQTNGLEFAALFNQRDSDSEDNAEAEAAITQAAGNITSVPATGGGMFQWSTNTVTVQKNAGSVTVQLLRTGPNSLPVKVSYTTYPVTADTNDYATTAGIISFAAGQTNQAITVPIFNNPDSVGPRQFTLELISASGGAWLGNLLTSVVNIASPPSFINASLRAGGGLTVQVNALTNQVMTVDVSSNLVQWQRLGTVTNVTGVLSITDTNAPAHHASFYRLSIP